ncbi:MAG: hypothetical protein LV479_12980 [Methylacidiphilales bacterium]|nr:hypothetical protein [Candidatus Methylacidiphilales bacterium]
MENAAQISAIGPGEGTIIGKTELMAAGYFKMLLGNFSPQGGEDESRQKYLQEKCFSAHEINRMACKQELRKSFGDFEWRRFWLCQNLTSLL